LVAVRAVAALARLGVVGLGLALAVAPWNYTLASQSDNDAADIAQGKELFESYACGSCHTLADDGAMGQVGPSLDGNPNLSTALIISRITDGQGAMPPFGDQMSEDEIADLAAYVMHAAAK
jgi:mono/diheme cytochrome c family protein